MKKIFRDYIIALIGAIVLTLILDAPLLKSIIIFSVVYFLITVLVLGYEKRKEKSL